MASVFRQLTLLSLVASVSAVRMVHHLESKENGSALADCLLTTGGDGPCPTVRAAVASATTSPAETTAAPPTVAPMVARIAAAKVATVEQVAPQVVPKTAVPEAPAQIQEPAAAKPTTTTTTTTTTMTTTTTTTTTSTTTTTTAGLVTCKFTVDNVVDSVFYDGKDILATVSPHTPHELGAWPVAKQVTFRRVPGAYLVIAGSENDSQGSCGKSGLGIVCTEPSLNEAANWEAYGSNQAISPSDVQRLGQGGGWGRPCLSTSGFSLADQRTYLKIWSGEQRYAAFRWRTPAPASSPLVAPLVAAKVTAVEPLVQSTAAAPVTCTFTVDNQVDSVNYDHRDITSFVTPNGPALAKWEQAKTFTISPVGGTFLVISGHEYDAVGSCQTSGLGIVCRRNGQVLPLSWQGVGHTGPLGASDSRLIGQGAGWGEPCQTSSGFYLAGEQTYTRIWAGRFKYATFRTVLV